MNPYATTTDTFLSGQRFPTLNITLWVTVVALQILLIDTYKLNHCKEMGAEPGRRFLKQPAEKLKAVFVALNLMSDDY